MQYITKENLPVFKYVNILPAEFYEDAENDLSLLMEYHERLKSGLTNGDLEAFFYFFYQTIILIYESSAMMERRYICIHCSIFNDVNHNINIVQKGDIL